MLTDHEIEGLIDEWYDDASIHSFEHTMLAGPAFEELKQVEASRLAPFIFRRLRDEDFWMGYQAVARRVTGADIWEGYEPLEGWRAYDVDESGKAWLQWAFDNKMLDSIEIKHDEWHGNRCYNCLKADKELIQVANEPNRRVLYISCSTCGILIHITHTFDESGNCIENSHKRLWRDKKAE